MCFCQIVVPSVVLFLNYTAQGYFSVRSLFWLTGCTWKCILNAKHFKNVIFCNLLMEDQSGMFITSRNCVTECSLCLTFVEEVHQILVYLSKKK